MGERNSLPGASIVFKAYQKGNMLRVTPALWLRWVRSKTDAPRAGGIYIDVRDKFDRSNDFTYLWFQGISRPYSQMTWGLHVF